MGHCRPWKALRIHRRLCLCLCLLVLGMLLGNPLWAADVLLTASDDNSSVRTFTEELAAQRPRDQVRFVPLAQLPPPGQSVSYTHLTLPTILLV